MELSELFFNRWERLRSGWRVLLFVCINFVLTLVLLAVVGIGLTLLLRSSASARSFLEGLGGWFTQPLVILTASTVAGILCSRLLEGLPARALGWGTHRGWAVDCLKGTVVGAVSLGLAALVIFVSGGYRFSLGHDGTGAILKTLVMSGLVFIIAAAAEEALFRGYPLQTMTRAQLAVAGLILTSLVFAYIHRNNPNNPPGLPPFTYVGINFINFPFINTALAGLWLGVGYLKTRSLWFPLGLHWSWNWTMGAILGLPVSGIERLTPAPLMRASDVGPAWLTGGGYGVEGGAACTLALLISTIFIWRASWLRPTPEMLELTDKENPRESSLAPPSGFLETPVAGEAAKPLESKSPGDWRGGDA